MDILTIKNLSKSFGNNNVIDDLSLSVPQNSIFGFIGQNGAGKTTTMKMILGLIKSNGGEINICSETVRFGQTKTNKHIGYLPDVPEFYPYMRPKEYLDLCGKITGLSAEKIKSRTDELLTLVGLSNIDKKIGSFSRGMKQRLGIAQALLNKPKLLICDEPTSALDPVGRKQILDILLSVKGKTTVIFSTHILSDVERICDHIAVLHKGKIPVCGTLAELKSHYKAENISIEFATKADKDRFACLFSTENNAEIVESEFGVILQTNNIIETQITILELFLREKILPQKLNIEEPSIENLFLEVIS